MNATEINTATLRALRADLAGSVLQRADDGYDAARTVYNALHDRWPALIVRAADVADVARVVRFAADEGLMLAVRGGNHSMRGHGSCDDGVVLDLGALRSVEVEPIARTVRVGGGATWGDVNDATHAHGLATTGGVVSTTGVAGLTLGGGFGYLTRRLGLACDNLIAAEIVTARGDVVSVNADHEPALFRAIRGGGGNFGVVTSFTFRLAPVHEVLGGPLVFPADAGVLQRYDAFMAAAPRALGAILGLTLAPPLPFVSEEEHFTPAAIVLACWSGDEAEGRDVIAGLRGLGRLRGEAIGRMPYPAINTLFDALLPAGLRHYWKSRFFGGLPPTALEPFVEHGRGTPNIESGIFFYPVDGAAADVPADATAWSHRDARYLVGFHGSWHAPADDARLRAWVDGAHQACGTGARAGAYVNFASDDAFSAPTEYGALHGPLVAAKRRYDPHNLFCLNANIDPDAVHAR
jgi:FAD/FMN-containing dehydrogenase